MKNNKQTQQPSTYREGIPSQSDAYQVSKYPKQGRNYDSSGKRIWKRGDSDAKNSENGENEIAMMQDFLKSKGMYKGEIDGVFGPKTEAAVKKYQKWFNDNAKEEMWYTKDGKNSERIGGKLGKKIAVDGVVGDQTRTALMYREMPKETPKPKKEWVEPEFPVGESRVKYSAEDYTPTDFPDSPMNYQGGLEMLGLAMMGFNAGGAGLAAAESELIGANAARNLIQQGTRQLTSPRVPLNPTVPKPLQGIGGRSFGPKTPSSYGTKINYTTGGYLNEPVDPLKPIASPQESVGLKAPQIMPFEINPYTPDNMLETSRLKLEANPITPTEQMAYKTQKTGDYQNYKYRTGYNRSGKSLIRERALGGLTTNESNLVEALIKNLDKPVSSFSNQLSMGGQILSSLAGLVPGVGGVLSTAVNVIDQQIDKSNPATPEVPKAQLNTNIYGNMAHGGMITKNFKQYNTGSHASGNDLAVNAKGNPAQGNNVVTVQNKENAYTNTKGESYVFSDVLVNPLTGNHFNKDAAKINKKYSKADSYKEEQNALEFSMNRLSMLNEIVKPKEQSTQLFSGGPANKKYSTIDDQTDFPMEELSVPLSDNWFFDAKTDQLYDPPMQQPSSIDTTLIKKPMVDKSNPTLNTVDAPITTDRTDYVSPYDRKPKNTEFNYNTVALGLKGLGLAKSIADSLEPAEIEKPILPDYRQSDKQMYATNIDYTQAKQDALAASNLAGNVNRSASGSLEQYMGRQAGNYANYADNIGRISMKEALDRNQQYVQRAGYEQGKALDTSNRLYQNRIDNQMNRANANLADQKLFTELTQIGSEFNEYQNYKEMVQNNKELTQAYINEGLAILNSKNTNFGFSEDFIERIKSGKASIDDLVKFVATTQSTKAETKTTD